LSGGRVRVSRGGAPGPEEAAAIAAALAALSGEGGPPRRGRSRWRLAGLLGRELPPRASLEGPLWARAGREGRG